MLSPWSSKSRNNLPELGFSSCYVLVHRLILVPSPCGSFTRPSILQSAINPLRQTRVEACCTARIRRCHFMNKTFRATLIAILLGAAAGAIFAIVPTELAQPASEATGPSGLAQPAIDAGPSGNWSGYYNHGGWSGYYCNGGFNGTIGPQGPDAIIVQGTPVVEQNREENHWIFLSPFVALLLYRLISFSKCFHFLQQNKCNSQGLHHRIRCTMANRTR